jgi:hypothetical protein
MDRKQAEKFRKAARALEADESEAAFDRVVKRLATSKGRTDVRPASMPKKSKAPPKRG